MPPVRRLAAILAADVAGYSRLMGDDEEGTHERLKAHLGELVEPKIRQHRGRIVKTTGDGLLAEFASIVDAVRCAAEVQRGMIDREPEVPDERRVRFRIGINLGDVIAERDDIYGDGVNIAARLEALAEPGGVCISRVGTSNASSAQPPKQAPMVRRSPGFNSPNQAASSSLSLPYCGDAGVSNAPMALVFSMATHAPAAGPLNSVNRRRAP
ncbi:MAG TPA: adenylate/guanylate cyclase domain-containing protein [Steroidobacteraceae bacterium]|nr:adenylate/guanylate cyclase domain-containing protein [Steroidobacteraceae bacterium]